MTEKQTDAPQQPSVLYVWLVRSEEVLEQPGSWWIRKWDTVPFPEGKAFALSEIAPPQKPVAWMSYESKARLEQGGNRSRATVPVHAERSNISCIPLYYAATPNGSKK